MHTTLLPILLLVSGPTDPPELLPPPRPVLETPAVVMLPPAVYRPDPRAVWQNYAPDGRGIFRPAVALEPYPHYKANGRTYYHLPTRTAQ
jgi:hypothetical protein